MPSMAVSAAPAALSRAPQWVIFSCDGHRFAVPVAHVMEIVPCRPLARLPGCGSEVAGLVNLRGRLVTVFDFGAILSLRASSSLPDHRLLIVEHGDRLAAFAVEQVVAVASPEGDSLAVAAEELRSLDVPTAETLGIGEWNGSAFVAMDSMRLLHRLWGEPGS